MSTKCYRGGNKHKFTSIYERSIPAEVKEILKIRAYHTVEYTNIYVFDICKWCGKKICKEDK